MCSDVLSAGGWSYRAEMGIAWLSRQQHVSGFKAFAAAGGPPGPTDGGSGGFGGDDENHGDGHEPSTKNSLLKGWEERIAADPQFTYKVFVEQVTVRICMDMSFDQFESL